MAPLLLSRGTMKSIYLLLPIVLFLGITPAFGGYIDFTVAPFDQIHDQSTWSTTVDGIEITFTAYDSGGPLNFYWDDNDGYRDGIGIQTGEQDEVEYPEIMKLSFSETILFGYAFLTDLFYESGYQEEGYYWFDGSSEVHFYADLDQPTGTHGEKTLYIDQYVDHIYFSALGDVWNGGTEEDHEYSVGGIYITKVPEPSTLLLLSTGLLAGAAFRKRLF